MAKPLPTPEQAYEGGEAAIFNAQSLYESAEAAADKGNVGVAIALTVLAVEEAVKARALFGLLLSSKIGRPFGLKARAFRDILYYKHAMRHALAVLQEMSDETRTALLTGAQPQDERGREALRRDVEMARWLTDANTAKLRGLYVDFRDGTWLQPKDVRPEEWERARAVARPFIEETRRQQGAARAL